MSFETFWGCTTYVYTGAAPQPFCGSTPPFSAIFICTTNSRRKPPHSCQYNWLVHTLLFPAAQSYAHYFILANSFPDWLVHALSPAAAFSILALFGIILIHFFHNLSQSVTFLNNENSLKMYHLDTKITFVSPISPETRSEHKTGTSTSAPISQSQDHLSLGLISRKIFSQWDSGLRLGSQPQPAVTICRVIVLTVKESDHLWVAVYLRNNLSKSHPSFL